MEKDETIQIAWVHHGQVSAMFAYSLLLIMKEMPDRIGSINTIRGLGLLAKSRNMVVQNFLDKSDDDWLFMVDSDEFIGVNEFKKLVDAAEESVRPFMCGLYFAANSPNPAEIDPVPLIFINTGGEDGVQPYWDYPRNQVIKIFAAGTGAMLVHRSVFEWMREAYSEDYGADWCWFQDGPLSGNRWLSEDLTFCARVQDLGIPMHAHTGALFAHQKEIWLDENSYLTNTSRRTKEEN